jgi:ergothioneine biosynthesis protein EgtB
VIEVGLHHEQQHQELILTDIKHVLACNPLRPAYQTEGAGPAHGFAAGTRAPDAGNGGSLPDHRASTRRPTARTRTEWSACSEGVYWIGNEGRGFAFDNETPRHRVFLEPFQVATRLVTSGDYLVFVEDGGYIRPEFWLSDGWTAVQTNGWNAPLYWEKRDGGWWTMTLSGMRALDEAEPVCHVSYYEADAYARWAGARLPSEAEWEVVAADVPIEGNFVERGRLHPEAAPDSAPSGAVTQLYGDVWEWTASAYAPYPGYRPWEGMLGEYNAKFMCNQMVLRGGACATPRSHVRPSYRNFFPPDARWQFTGIRLARNTSLAAERSGPAR